MVRRLLLAIVLALALSGCGTVMDIAGFAKIGGQPDNQFRIYGGVRIDALMVSQAGRTDPFGFFFVLDFPVSFAFDTVLLPFTAIYTLAKGRR